ncbi:glycosyltransferase family 2 protein [bacterium]|nr:glycosyltransferase family 2 protein [bacterium]
MVAVAVAIPVCVVSVQCLAALLLARPAESEVELADRGAFCVLIPAHNEEVVLRQTLVAIVAQLSAQDRVLVVADNCSDQTVAIAKDVGVGVLERHHAEHRGKGYALDAGIRQLEKDGFAGSCVIIIDADCDVAADALHLLAAEVSRSGRSAQARYVMHMPVDPSPRDYVSALALRVRNIARARGMHNLRLPCQVTGSGIAIPWHAIRKLNLASGNIVEDMQIGLDLAQMRLAAVYVEAAHVTGRLASGNAAQAQRKRWEHGHLGTSFGVVPRLLCAGIARGNLQQVALAVDLAILPLALLASFVVAVVVAACALGGLTGYWLALWVSAGSLVSLAVAFLVGWWVSSRGIIPLRTLLGIPVYVFWKIPMWVMSVLSPQKEWVRSSRKQ